MDNVYGAVIMTQVILRVHPVHLPTLKPGQRPKRLGLSPLLGCCIAYTHHHTVGSVGLPLYLAAPLAGL